MSKRRLALLLLVLGLAGCARRTLEAEEIIEGPAVDREKVRAIYGYRYGDVLKVGDVDFEKSVVSSHFKTPDWPDAYFLYDKTEAEQDGRKQTVAKVRSIVLQDETIYGSWVTTFKFNK